MPGCLSHLPHEMESKSLKLHEELADQIYKRANPEAVTPALERLGCRLFTLFREFYEKYSGPFSSEHNGFLLLDPLDDHPTIVSQTEEVRVRFGFPEHYLVLSDLLANAVIVYDSRIDAVYDVDFEGGETALKAQGRHPRADLALLRGLPLRLLSGRVRPRHCCVA